MPREIFDLMKEVRARFAYNVQRLREDSDWTQEALAEESRMTLRQVQHGEAGTRNPTTQSIACMAFAFGVDVAELLSPVPGSRPIRRRKRPRRAPSTA